MFERNSVFIRSTSRSRRMSRSTYTEPTTSPVTPVSGPVLIETGTSPTRSAPDHDDGPPARATGNPTRAATGATRKSDRKRLRRVESTAEVGVAETIASTGRPPLIAPIGRAATNVPPLVADASPAPDSTDRASRSAAGGG